MRRKPTSYGVWKCHVNLILFLLATFQELREGQDYYCEHCFCFDTYNVSRHREKGSCTRSKSDHTDVSTACSIFLSDTMHCGDRFLIPVSIVLPNITWILLPSGNLWGPHTNNAPEALVYITETRNPHQVSCVVAFNHTTEFIAIVWPYCITFFNMRYIRNVKSNFI